MMADNTSLGSNRSSIAGSSVDSYKPSFDAQSSVEPDDEASEKQQHISSDQFQDTNDDALGSGSADEFQSSSPESQPPASPVKPVIKPKPSFCSSCGEAPADQEHLSEDNDKVHVQPQNSESDDDPQLSAHDRSPTCTDVGQQNPDVPQLSDDSQQIAPPSRSFSDQPTRIRPQSSADPTPSIYNITSTLDELKSMVTDLEAMSAFERGLKSVLKLLISQVTEMKAEQFHQNQNILMRHEQIMKNLDDAVSSATDNKHFERRGDVAREGLHLERDSDDSLYGPSESDSEPENFSNIKQEAAKNSNAEILPPPTPNSELEEETDQHNGHQDTGDVIMEQEKPLTPVTPEPEEKREPLVRQDSKDSTGSRDDYKIRRPSTIFSPSGDGSVVSPWGPPTKSMKKKKGWIEPEKPVTVKPKQEIKKIVADTNELFNVFERRNKGESISKSITDKDGSRTDEKAMNEIGGNIHLRISFSQPATLHVEVKQADDLVVSIKNKTCNPYAVVTLLGEYEVFKTEVVAKTQNPVWNQTFDFALPLKFLQTTAVLVVLYNKHGESHEEFLGEVHISLAAYKHFKVIDNWYALEDLRGEEAKFDGYKELQKVLRSLKTKAPMSLPDTLRQDELRKAENFNSY